MKENGLKINLKEKENIFAMTGAYTKETGKIISNTDSENAHGKMAQITKASI